MLGTVGALITGSTLFGQLERGLNRIYGVEQDRPSVQKYGLALLLSVTAGACAAAAFVVFAFGREIGLRARFGSAHGLGHRALADRARAHRRGDGAAVPVVSPPPTTGVVVARVRVGAVGRVVVGVHTRVGPDVPGHARRSATRTVRSRASSHCRSGRSSSSISILYGAAVAAQLEAVRAGEPEVQDHQKIDDVPAQPDSEKLVTTY